MVFRLALLSRTYTFLLNYLCLCNMEFSDLVAYIVKNSVSFLFNKTSTMLRVLL